MKPDQQDAVTALYERNCLVVGKLGVGKTVVAATAVAELLDDKQVQRVLIVTTPKIANSVWAQEFAKWPHTQHIRVAVATGTPEERLALVKSDAPVCVVTFNALPWMKKEKLFGLFDGLLVDETTKLKETGGAWFKAIRPHLKKFVWRAGLTGTPVNEDFMGLFGQMMLVDAGASLGTRKEAFLNRYFYATDYKQYNWALKEGAEKQLLQAIAPHVHVMPEYRGELPPIEYRPVSLTMPDTLAAYYDKMRRDMVTDDAVSQTAAVLVQKLQQITSGFVYDEAGEAVPLSDYRVTALLDLLGSLKGQNVIIVYWYKEDLQRLRTALPEAEELNPKTLAATVKRWNAGEIEHLLIHPRCLHPSTEVLTEFRGWVRIIDVRKDERVFDGVEFVSHKGCSFSGIRPVIEVEGITLTPNHKLLVGGVWMEAKDVRSDPSFRGKAYYTYEGDDPYLGKMLPLSKGKRHNETGLRQSKPRAAETLRGMSQGGFSLDDKYPFLEYLAGYGQPSVQSIRPRLHSIRGCWSRCFGRLVGVQKLLRGYVRHLPRPSDNRSDRQRFGVLKRKLSVGYECCAAGEQIKQSTFNVYGGADAPRRVLSSGERFAGGDNAEIKQGDDARASGRSLSCVDVPKEAQVSEVYDLVDCGPRNRFLIRNDDGDVFISHNSAGHGLQLEQGGHTIIWYSPVWSNDLWEQTNARVWRRGQKHPVHIYTLEAVGTIDELVSQRVEMKAQFDKLFNQHLGAAR